MDQQRARLLADAAPHLAPLLSLGVQYYMEQRQVQRQTEAQLEIIEAKQESSPSLETASSQAASAAAQSAASSQPTDYTSEIDQRMQGESCGKCVDALKEMKTMPPSLQRQGLDEFDELKRLTEQADDPSVVKEFLDGTDVLGDALDRAM